MHSWAIVVCAKEWPDLIAKSLSDSTMEFYKLWTISILTICKRGPGHIFLQNICRLKFHSNWIALYSTNDLIYNFILKDPSAHNIAHFMADSLPCYKPNFLS